MANGNTDTDSLTDVNIIKDLSGIESNPLFILSKKNAGELIGIYKQICVWQENAVNQKEFELLEQRKAAVIFFISQKDFEFSSGIVSVLIKHK